MAKDAAAALAKTLSDKQKDVIRAAVNGTTLESLKVNKQCDARNVNPLVTKKLVKVTKKGEVSVTGTGRRVAEALSKAA